MNLIPAPMTVKSRLLALALATIAVVAIGSLGIDGAGAASSGGIGIGGGSGGSGSGGSGSAGGSAAGANDADAGKYDRIWGGVSARDRRWARRTSKCESGGDPDAIGGGGLYRGAFQFMKSTWKHSPKSPGGDPIAFPYRTQAVVAVLLKKRDGTRHWPVCG